MREIRNLIVHHSASPRKATVEDIRRWHRERGWSDIGYHHVIEQNGTIRQGRPLPQTGAHARGVNSVSIGVCVTGDNTSPGDEWTDIQKAALRSYIRSVKMLFPGIHVLGHRDVNPRTLCPGLDVQSIIGG